MTKAPVEFKIVREVFGTERGEIEGYTLGSFYWNSDDGTVVRLGSSLEDEDRHLEEGGVKVYGKTAMPLGRYRLTLYKSPKHGVVPLFHDVDGFTYTEIHGANFSKQLQGCVAIGRERTAEGVRDCAPLLQRVVAIMQSAAEHGREVYCTISRFKDEEGARDGLA